jgi:host factor-I protein
MLRCSNMREQPMADGSARAEARGETNRARLQDMFLEATRKAGARLTVFLMSGPRLEGRVVGWDDFTLILDRGDGPHAVYKSAIAALATSGAVEIEGDGWKHGLGGSGAGPRPGPRPQKPASTPVIVRKPPPRVRTPGGPGRTGPRER